MVPSISKDAQQRRCSAAASVLSDVNKTDLGRAGVLSATLGQKVRSLRLRDEGACQYRDGLPILQPSLYLRSTFALPSLYLRSTTAWMPLATRVWVPKALPLPSHPREIGSGDLIGLG